MSALDGWTKGEFTHDGVTHPTYRKGDGPGVIVIHEIPGITPEVIRFADEVAARGHTVVMPHLFGEPGAPAGIGALARSIGHVCVSREFTKLAAGRTSPVADWLRSLARELHADVGGPGVGAVGMCLTGNFALTMMLEPAVLAPVLCQPSLPLDNPAGLESSAEELATIRVRLERDGLDVMAYRFKGDVFCRAERFASYRAALGDHFVEHVLPDTAANPNPPPFYAKHVPTPHSVVTAHLIDEAGQPTLMARDQILDFLVRTCTAARS